MILKQLLMLKLSGTGIILAVYVAKIKKTRKKRLFLLQLMPPIKLYQLLKKLKRTSLSRMKKLAKTSLSRLKFQ